MPRTKAQYAAMRTATRDKIHAAAIKLFAQKGVAATSVQDIAERAGISTGLLYRHYASKEDLYHELIHQAADGLAENVKLFQSDASPLVIIQQFIAEVLHDLATVDTFTDFLLLMAQSSTVASPSPHIQYLQEQSTSLLKQTATLIERGQALGQFRQGDALELAHFFFASVHGLTMMKHLLQDEFIVPAPHIVTAFLIKEDDHDRSETGQ